MNDLATQRSPNWEKRWWKGAPRIIPAAAMKLGKVRKFEARSFFITERTTKIKKKKKKQVSQLMGYVITT